MKAMKVDITQEDIDAGLEAVVKAGPQGHPERICAGARAIARETLRAVGVTSAAWHFVAPEGKKATPGVALPDKMIAWLKEFDAAVEDERRVRKALIYGDAKAERRVPNPAPATFTIPVPA